METHDLSGTDAVVLAGGLGTRLAPLVTDLPKLLAPVAGRPFLERLLDMLAGAGIRRVILCLGHLHDKVLAHLAARAPGAALEIVPCVEQAPLGTGGALRNAVGLLRSDPILVLNGDSLVDADLTAFLSFHRQHGARASMVLAAVADASRFGAVQVDSRDAVVAFHERPAPGTVPVGSDRPVLVNAGVYLLARELVDGIPAGRPVSLEREVFPAWCGQGRFFGFSGPFRLIDIGTPESFTEAQRLFPAGPPQQAALAAPPPSGPSRRPPVCRYHGPALEKRIRRPNHTTVRANLQAGRPSSPVLGSERPMTTTLAAAPARRRETEPSGITYDRFRVARLLERLKERLALRRVLEVPSTGAKACPSLYSLPLAMAGCDVTLVNPFPPAFEAWRRLGVASRLSSVKADPAALPFPRDRFDMAWNFVTLGWQDSLVPALTEMARVAPVVLLVQQNGYNVGYPWHRFLHWVFRVEWDHGQTRYFFPANVRREMEAVGLERLELGLLDQVPWPDPPGFRDIRLHLAGKKPHPEEDIDWSVPAVDCFERRAFPAWMRMLGGIEELPIPQALRWPVNHLFYMLGFRRAAR
jgi:NDP-sugar pyrophosphorylase family protein